MSTIELNTSITDAEWEVMRVVWANDLVTSKTVISVLKEKMDWTESTIKTILGRLVEKGVLNTEKEGRKFIYTANIEEKEAVRNYAEDILKIVRENWEKIAADYRLTRRQIEEMRPAFSACYD